MSARPDELNLNWPLVKGSDSCVKVSLKSVRLARYPQANALIKHSKVKCDEKPGICANCERLHLECQKADGTKIAPSAAGTRLSDPPLRDVGIKRKRTFRSCSQCRASKARCSGQKPKCSRCRQRQVDCIYDEESSPQWERVVQSSRAESSQLEPSVSESNSNSNNPTHGEEVSEAPTRTEIGERSPLQTSRSMSMDRPIPSITALPGPSRTIPSRSSSVRGYNIEEGPDSLEWLVSIKWMMRRIDFEPVFLRGFSEVSIVCSRARRKSIRYLFVSHWF